MQIAIRSYVNAGVAVLGAGVIVASNTALPVHTIHLPSIHSGAMNLAAAVTPIDVYSQVLREAATNIQTLAAGADPGLILKQIVANQIDSVTTLVGAVQTADQAAANLTSELSVEAFRVDDDDQLPRYVSSVLARLQEVWVGRQIAEVKSKLQRMSPVEHSDEYHALFGDLVAMEAYRRSLLEQASGDDLTA